jgi:adenosylcobinamide-phosphate synthase
MVGEVAVKLTEIYHALLPDAYLLGFGVLLDAAIGDPTYAWHPIRIVGRTLTWMESRLRSAGLNGYIGGVFLFIWLAAAAVGVTVLIISAAGRAWSQLGLLVHLSVVYFMLALGDLLRHVWKIEAALRAGNASQARSAVGELVGRDTDRMDAGACRRAAVESLSENFTDGFVSPLFWYVLAGLPGLVVFKVVSTMDSMVGFKNDRYLRFGWCGARLDDLMNYLPARLAWLMIALAAACLPGYSASQAWKIGLAQHGLLPSPNSGWSEAAVAGALRRRLVGPIWLGGQLVTDIWIGDAHDAPLDGPSDVSRALALVAWSGVVTTAGAITCVLMMR